MWYRIAKLVALAATLSAGSACTEWQLQRVSPQQGLAAEAPDAVELTLMDGQRVVLHDPVLRDSLIEGPDLRTKALRRVRTSHVAEWRTQQGDRVGTAAAAGMVAVGVWAFYRGLFGGF